MRKLICAMMVVIMMVSATSAFADGRGRGGHGGHGNHGGRGGGMSDSSAAWWGVGLLVFGASLGAFSQQQTVPQHELPAYYQYQIDPYQQVRIPPENHFIGECLPYGGEFPGGVNVPGRGYFPPGVATPGFCF